MKFLSSLRPVKSRVSQICWLPVVKGGRFYFRLLQTIQCPRSPFPLPAIKTRDRMSPLLVSCFPVLIFADNRRSAEICYATRPNSSQFVFCVGFLKVIIFSFGCLWKLAWSNIWINICKAKMVWKFLFLSFNFRGLSLFWFYNII